jgi:hypothetical protein
MTAKMGASRAVLCGYSQHDRRHDGQSPGRRLPIFWLEDAAAAYRRRDLFAKRAKLMEEWASYCAGPRTANVVPIRRNKKA